MRISDFKSKGLCLFALLVYLAMFLQINTVSAVEVFAFGSYSEKRFVLPSGEEIEPKYGEINRFEGIDSLTVIHPTIDLIGAAACRESKIPYRSTTEHASKEISISLKTIGEHKNKQFCLAALPALYTVRKKDKPLVLLTGVGIKPIDYVFRDITTNNPSHTEINVAGQKYKANIGAATAYELCRKGYEVMMIARTEDKLKIIQQWIKKKMPSALIDYSAFSIADQEATSKLLQQIPEDKTVFWVQSVGLGGGTVKVKDDNPYLSVDNISAELIEAELSVLADTVKFLQALLPRFRSQLETRICIVSSMSAIRSVPFGSIHNASKAAISRFANAAMLELDKEKIYITDVRPGAVDTGMYDNIVVQEAVRKIAASMNYDWSESAGGIRLAPPSSVGKLIAEVLSSEAHITSLNLVARGQFPHEGS